MSLSESSTTLLPSVPRTTAPTLTDGQTTPLLPLEQLVQDQAWELELLTVLSEIEQRLVRITRRAFRTAPQATLQELVELIGRLDAYTAFHGQKHVLIIDRLADARRASQPFLAAVAALPPDPSSGTIRLWLSRQSPPSLAQLPTALAILGTMPRVFEAYLMALANGFTTGQAAAKWIETCSVFLRQANKIVRLVSA